MNQVLHDPTHACTRIADIDVFIEGRGEDTIVMLHGWPDTYRLWDSQVAAFRDSHRCVRFTLPGFDLTKPRRAYSLDETTHLIKQIVEQTCAGQRVTLMLHDWGCVFGYEFYMRHPALVSRIIGCDVGDAGAPEFIPSLNWKAKAMVVGYQVWLALAWRVGGGIGNRMTRFMVHALHCQSDLRHIDSRMNYPYWIKWSGAHGSYRGAARFDPGCPLLFVYGTRKPFMFHTPGWLERLARKPGCRVAALDSDHWVMRGPAQQQFNREVAQWLAQLGPAAGPS